MKKILIVMQREFLMVVAERGYLMTLVGIPLFLLLFGGLLKYAASQSDQTRESGRIGVIDRAGVIDFSLTETALAADAAPPSAAPSQSRKLTFVRCEQLDEALQSVVKTELDALYMVEADFLESGATALYTREIWRGRSARGLAAFEKLLHRSLLKKLSLVDGQAASEALNRVLDPAKLKEMNVTDKGEILPVQNRWAKISRLFAPIGLALLLGFSLAISSGYLLQSTAEEKENRVIEVMLSSITPEQLMWGKILGLGSAALLQVALYLIVIGLSVSSWLAFVDLTPLKLAGCLLYCAVGYLFFAGLLATTGLIGGNIHDSTQLAAPVSLLGASPVFFIINLMSAPNGMMAQVLSYIPVTAPVTMIFRLTMTTVPIGEIIISLALLTASAYWSVQLAAKTFRVASLMYGQRFILPEVWRWLRQA